MKRRWIELNKELVESPLTYWVHRARCSFDALQLLPGSGWPTYFVELDGFVFRFASLAEIDHVIEILGRKVLPRPSTLAASAHSSHGHANQHWLSTMPAETKAWKYRKKAIDYLNDARREFERSISKGV